MKAVVFHDIGDIRLDDVKEPKIKNDHDAILRLTASAICGTDLHMIRGTMPGMKPGTILGHEGVGVVEDLGKEVRNFRRGDRVVIPSTISCGYCSYCRAGYTSQCDNANPNGSLSGTALFGGPAATGAFDGLQAEMARIPYANAIMVKVPDNVSDDEAILISDIFPTGYFGAELAKIHPGHTVAVFGCGPVGQFAILSAFLFDAGRVIAIDNIQSRLDMARDLGAEVINFDKDDPIKAVRELTGGIGVDRAIDAVGIDAVAPSGGPAAKAARQIKKQSEQELKEVAPKTSPEGDNWHPGDAPSQAVTWAITALAKAGTLSIIGVYPQTYRFFPFGLAMNKNLTIKTGNCNHRKYIPYLLNLVENGTVKPTRILTNIEPLTYAVDAYKLFDERGMGWVKVGLLPTTERAYTVRPGV